MSLELRRIQHPLQLPALFIGLIALAACGGGTTSTIQTQTGPSTPANLTATAVSATQINLTWSASTSSVGIANYIVQRCTGASCSTFAQIATPATVTYNDIGVIASTAYSYRVEAVDTAANTSSFSLVASATTPAVGAPSTPGNLTATAVSAPQINLSWSASTSSLGIAHYVVQRCAGASCTNFAQIATPTAVTFNDTGLAASTSYSYRVQAIDTASNASGFSTVATATTPAVVVQPPTTPANLTATAASPTQINLTWSASTSSIGIANYIVQRCTGASCSNFASITTPTGTNFSDTGLSASTSYSYRVQAVDTASTASGFSNVATQTTQATQSQPPSTPGTPVATVISPTEIDLTWTASTSTVGLSIYVVQRCTGASCTGFAQIATPAVTSFKDTGLTPSTTYNYRVQAVDTAQTVSLFSGTTSASTQAAPPPTAPGSLTATAASSTQINLSWTASTSSVGIANYVVDRCSGASCSNFTQLATPTGTTYNDTGLTPSTSYSYEVQAVDTANSSGPFSSVATATTGSGSTSVVFPLKASANNRYLVDQNSTPFLLMGDSPHAMFTNLSLADAATYLQDRQNHGFNALWCEMLDYPYVGGNMNATTYDGIAPFTGGSGGTYDISTPNEAYFARVDAMINLAAAHGMVVLLDALDNGGWMATFESNGDTKAFNWGQYIGNRYKNFPNIIWIMGNDFQSWQTNSGDNALGINVMAGIASVDPNHLQTTELNYNISGSLDDALLVSNTSLAGAYTYYPAYWEVLNEYNSTAKTVPVFLEETYYDGGSYGNLTPNLATNLMLRKVAYQTVLSGGLAGYMYGTIFYDFHSGWQSGIDVTSATQLGYWKTLVTSLPWYNLAPDQTHAAVTSGYGTATGQNQNSGTNPSFGVGNIQTDNFVTTSISADGSLVMAYCPASTTITVNMAKLKSSATARWFDPSNGTFTAISGSPFANTGSQNFTTPGTNSEGDPDWLLVLQAQ